MKAICRTCCLTLPILKLLLDQRVVDIRKDLEVLQMELHGPELGFLDLQAAGLLGRKGLKSGNLLAHRLDIAHLLFPVCDQNLACLLETLEGKLLEGNVG